MWIYEQTEPESKLALVPQLTGITPEPKQTATAPPEHMQKTVDKVSESAPEKKLRTPTRPCATQDCWLLAAAFLLGCTAAGVLQAVCDARQAELLQYYLDAWRALFAPGSLQRAVHLFGMEYLTLGLVVSLFMLLGLSALGPVMIFGSMMLYGLGSGLLLVQLSAAGGWKTVLPTLLWTGAPAAAASGCLCFFGASALQVSSRIHAYSFRNRTGGQARPGVQALMGQYLLTMVVLLPLCGAAAGLSYLENCL